MSKLLVIKQLNMEVTLRQLTKEQKRFIIDNFLGHPNIQIIGMSA